MRVAFVVLERLAPIQTRIPRAGARVSAEEELTAATSASRSRALKKSFCRVGFSREILLGRFACQSAGPFHLGPDPAVVIETYAASGSATGAARRAFTRLTTNARSSSRLIPDNFEALTALTS